jgi:hypothetical protein
MAIKTCSNGKCVILLPKTIGGFQSRISAGLEAYYPMKANVNIQVCFISACSYHHICPTKSHLISTAVLRHVEVYRSIITTVSMKSAYLLLPLDEYSCRYHGHRWFHPHTPEAHNYQRSPRGTEWDHVCEVGMGNLMAL